jgi:toxin ParE1/3/4
VKYRISDTALEDIDKIWLYTLENWSLEQANRYYRLIYQEILFIVEV